MNENNELKICNRCHQIKPINEFYIHDNSGRRMTKCKECLKKRKLELKLFKPLKCCICRQKKNREEFSVVNQNKKLNPYCKVCEDLLNKGIKKCNHCGNIKSLDEFNKNTDLTFKLKGWCKDCRKTWYYNRTERRLLSGAKNRAKQLNLPFNLELSDIVIPEYCPVLNIKLQKNHGHGPKYNSPTLDRIIPKNGYVKNNVKVISFRANTLKNNATIEEIEKILVYMKTN